MTTITIYKSKTGEYKRLSTGGHAEYADEGEDIVCSAISVLVINTLNSWDELTHEQMEIMIDEEEGIIDCRFSESLSEGGILLMNSLILGLKGIVNDYGKEYLQLKFKEV